MKPRFLAALPAADATSCSAVGLVSSTEYQVRVKAFNQVGDGPPSEVVVVMSTETPPSVAPTDVAVNTSTPGRLDVSWVAVAASDSGGFPLTGYTATAVTDAAGVADAMCTTALASETSCHD